MAKSVSAIVVKVAKANTRMWSVCLVSSWRDVTPNCIDDVLSASELDPSRIVALTASANDEPRTLCASAELLTSFSLSRSLRDERRDLTESARPLQVSARQLWPDDTLREQPGAGAGGTLSRPATSQRARSCCCAAASTAEALAEPRLKGGSCGCAADASGAEEALPESGVGAQQRAPTPGTAHRCGSSARRAAWATPAAASGQSRRVQLPTGVPKRRPNPSPQALVGCWVARPRGVLRW